MKLSDQLEEWEFPHNWTLEQARSLIAKIAVLERRAVKYQTLYGNLMSELKYLTRKHPEWEKKRKDET